MTPPLTWTPWVFLGSPELPIKPAAAGLYRIRVASRGDAMYVGQTGRCLRGRVAELARQVAKPEMPWNDPHTAAPSLWAWRKGCAGQYEVSVAGFDGERATRLATECWVVWQHRLEHGRSPAASFGRMPPGWTKSANRSSGRRGGPSPSAHPAPATAPLPASGHPIEPHWMGLAWSDWQPLDRSLRFTGVGLYRLRLRGHPVLAYIGETSSLAARLRDHLLRLRDLGDLTVSVASVDAGLGKTGRLEWENDLIAHHLAATAQPPRAQFGDGRSALAASAPIEPSGRRAG